MDEKQNILVSDDQPMIRDLFSIVLGKLGYHTVFACDGEEALEKVENNEFSLVFMDIMMPKMDGYTAAKRLRERGFKKPIIAVTANSLESECEACIKAGMNEVLLKPVKPAAIEKLLKKWIDNVQIEKAATNSVFDIADALDTFLNNKEAFLPVLTRFVERTAAQLEAFPLLEKAADWDNAVREAHTMKGAAFTMGGAELGEAAYLLEKAYRDAVKDEMTKAYTLVCEAFGRYKKEADEYIERESKCP